MKAMMPALLGCALILGCATSNSVHPLTRRASFDFNCPANQLRYAQIDNRSSGVVGCGKRATYVETCQGQGLNEQCTWVLNGAIESIEPAPQPASGPPGQAN